MFNVRVKRYLNTEQIIIYSEPLLNKDSEREDNRKVIRETGEVVPHNRRIIHDYFEPREIVTEEGNVLQVPYTEKIGYILHDEDDEESKKRSYRRTKQKVYDMVKCNNWEWFFTLTFNPAKVDSFNYDITTKKLSLWLNNMRKICPEMKYLVVPEKHPTSGRWHFHGLFANVDKMVFVDSGERDKRGRVIYNVGNYRLGFSTATKISDVAKASSYLCKYITKELCDVTKGKKRYWSSRNVDVPEVTDMLVMDLQNFIKELEEDATYSKEVKGYVYTRYYEKPIYTTNTDFSKRCRQKIMNMLYFK